MTELQEKLSDIHAQAERMAQRVHEVFDRAGGQMTMEDLVEALGEEEDLMIDGVPSELFSDFLRPGGSLESAIFNAMIHPAAKGAGWYAIPANVVSGPYWKRADLCDRYEITAFLIEMRYATGLWRPEMDAFLDQAAARFPEHATEFRAMVAEFKAAEKERDRLERSSWLKED